MSARARNVWVSYLRVSTAEQAAKDLSLPAQREAVEEYARRNGQAIEREYLESGCSGTDINRKAFRQMLEDVLKPGSDIGTIVVHHTSRFTRNAIQARVVKEQLRKLGVKVVSVCQELNDDHGTPSPRTSLPRLPFPRPGWDTATPLIPPRLPGNSRGIQLGEMRGTGQSR